MLKNLSKKYSNIRIFFQKEQVLLICCLLLILAYFLPYIILGEDSSLLIHDNLDSLIAWMKIFLGNYEIFSSPSTKIYQIFNGIPRSSISGSFDISLIWFKLFGIYWGYVFNKFLIALFGFVGMYYLLKKHFLPTEVYKIIPCGVALIFALLPFWSFSMSISGLPLVLFAFLNLRNKDYHFSNWLIILIFPFYSSLVFSGVFFMVIITLVFIYDTYKSKIINYNFLLGIILLGFNYVISHFPLFYTFIFSSGHLSHRVEFKDTGLNIFDAINQVFEIFKNGQYHAHSLHTFILIPIILGLYLIIKSDKINKRYILILLFIILTSFFYGLLKWNSIAPIIKQLTTFIPIQLQRFHVLHPMFWYVLFGISLFMISKNFRFGKQIVMLILIFQFYYVLKYHELFANRHKSTFRQFYAEEQFSEIKSFIDKPQNSYRVISLGMHPSIAQFNGFYTLDSYCADYPLKYKHDFRKIISRELDKNKELRDYFDNWGSRCYAFSSELGVNFMYEKSSIKKIEHLDFNVDAFHQLGGNYIISAVEINTIINNKYILKKIFENKDSFWKIYLYEV